MKTLYEELTEKGLSAMKLTLELVFTIPYEVQLDLTWGMDIITYKPIEVYQN